jgi:hypothetical protein
MTNRLENLARRLESDPFFVACPLKLYQLSERFDDESLATALKCSKESLVSIRLCRAPSGEHETFQDDIERIASRFSADADALAEALRRGQALFHMAGGQTASGTLLAARDGDKEPGSEQSKGGDA